MTHGLNCWAVHRVLRVNATTGADTADTEYVFTLMSAPLMECLAPLHSTEIVVISEVRHELGKFTTNGSVFRAM